MSTNATESRTTRKDKIKNAVVNVVKAKKQAISQIAKSQHAKELVQASVTLAATASKQAAIDACIAKVDAIVEECYANNCRFRDSTFDLLTDRAACVVSSATSSGEMLYIIDGAKRVSELIKNPVFFLDGASPDDIKQGSVGNCWHIAALAVVANIPGLLEQLCVKRNEEVGVYGFIFFRDGDWISTVVDDQLFYMVDTLTNKTSLVYGKCYSPRETWLPLLEKAYAKIHGDYESLEGGFTGDGIEDLTGGVSSLIFTADILDKDRFWREEMLQVNKTILMGCSIDYVDGTQPRTGLVPHHAYSVLGTAEYNGERLVHLRNPWGKVEWNGDWSDDSDKWTPEAIEALGAKNKDDGRFWMSYTDFMKIWDCLDRVRVFDESWHVSTTWIPYHVEPCSSGKFELTLNEASKVVLAMCQPDTRYFRSQKQEYLYKLAFYVYNEKRKLVKRAKVTVPFTFRGVNCELELKPGVYTIVPKVIREPLAVEDEKDEDEDSDEDEEENEEEAQAARSHAALFEAKKAKNAAKMARARVAGQTLVGIDEIDEVGDLKEDNEDDEEDEDEDDLDDWELTLGLRAYSHDPSMTLEGIPGVHPIKAIMEALEAEMAEANVNEEEEEENDDDYEDVEEVEDPEAVTSTRKGKREARRRRFTRKGKKPGKGPQKEE
ncbi:hypothetical protein BGW42_007136 [Actinomortierella wolfii]|nr:hypothetical protein BGW42_007136 [Actinomortierella wolfii]